MNNDTKQSPFNGENTFTPVESLPTYREGETTFGAHFDTPIGTTHYDEHAYSDETRKRMKDNVDGAIDLLFNTRIEELDNAQAKGMFGSVSLGLRGIDVPAKDWFGSKASDDPRENLKMLRRVLQGEWELMEDDKAKEFREAETDDERAAVMKREEGWWDKVARFFGTVGRGMVKGAASGQSVMGAVMVPTAVSPDEMKEIEQGLVQKDLDEYSWQMMAREKMLSLMNAQGAMSDRAGATLVASLAAGRLDRRQIAALPDNEKMSVMAAFKAIRGPATSGRILGVKTDFDDGWGVTDRAQMMLYGFQNSVCALATDTYDLATDTIGWAYSMLWLEGEERDRFNREWQAIRLAEEHERQELPKGGGVGSVLQGLAENAHWFLAYGLGGVAKGAKAARIAKETEKWTRVGSPLLSLATTTQNYQAAMKSIDMLRKAVSVAGATKKGKIATGVMTGAKAMTVSSFAEEFLRTADAAGLDREASLPLAFAVALVNDKIEQFEVPGLSEHISPVALQAMSFQSLVRAMKMQGVKGAVDWGKMSVKQSLRAGAITGVNEGWVEEPLQQLVIDHAACLGEAISEWEKESYSLGEGLKNAAIKQCALVADDVQTYFDVVGEMAPMSVGYLLGTGPREAGKATLGRKFGQFDWYRKMKKRMGGATLDQTAQNAVYAHEGRLLEGAVEFLEGKAGGMAADAAIGKTQEGGEADGAAEGAIEERLPQGTRFELKNGNEIAYPNEGESGAADAETFAGQLNGIAMTAGATFRFVVKDGKIVVDGTASKVQLDEVLDAANGGNYADAIEAAAKKRALWNDARDLIECGWGVWQKHGKGDGDVVSRLMADLQIPQSLAEQMAETFSEQEIYRFGSDEGAAFVRGSHIATLTKEEFEAHKLADGESYQRDEKTGRVAVRMKVGAEKFVTIVYEPWKHPVMREDGTVDYEYLAHLTADDSAFGVSWDASANVKSGAMPAWKDLDLYNRRRAVLEMNGNADGGGRFEFTDENGNTTVVEADGVVHLATGRVRDLAYKILPKVDADAYMATERTMLSSGTQLEHETWHRLWKAVRATLSEEEVASLKAALNIPGADDAALDEAMAYDFEQFGVGNYVAEPAETAIGRGLQKFAEVMTRIGLGDARRQKAKVENGHVVKDKNGEVQKEDFVLEDFYRAVMEGRLGSGNLGIKRAGEEAAEGSAASKTSAVDAAKNAAKNGIPVSVSEAELAAQEKKEEEAAEEMEGTADDAAIGKTQEGEGKEGKEGVAEGAAGKTGATESAAGETRADDGEDKWRYHDFDDWDHGTWIEMKVAGKPDRVKCKLVVKNVFDLTTSFQDKNSEYQDRSDAKGGNTLEGEKRARAIQAGLDKDFGGAIEPTWGGKTIVVDKKGYAIVGNHRTYAVMLAAEANSPLWQAFKEKMLAIAAYRGLEVDEHAAEAPIIVAEVEEIEGDLTLKDLVGEGNKSEKADYKTSDKAMKDAQVFMEKGVINDVVFKSDGTIDLVKTAPGAEAFFKEIGLVDGVEDHQGVDPMGFPLVEKRVSPTGLARLQNTILATLLGGDANATTIIDALADPKLDVDNERNALVSAAGNVLKIANEKPMYDIRAQIGAALAKYLGWRRLDAQKREDKKKTPAQWQNAKGAQTWEEYFAQGDLLAGRDPLVDLIAKRFADSRKLRKFANDGREYDNSKERAVKYVAEWFEKYAQSARNVNTDAVDMFGNKPAEPIELMQVNYSVADLREMAFSSGGDWAKTELDRIYEMALERVAPEAVTIPRLYHGGQDFLRPSLRFVGTGEGSAALGHGFYVSSLKDDSKEYAEVAANNRKEATVCKKIGQFFGLTPKWTYELSLHDARLRPYKFPSAKAEAEKLIEICRAAGYYPKDAEKTMEALEGDLRKRPSVARMEVFLGSVLRPNGEPLTIVERGALMVRSGIDATINLWAGANNEVVYHFVVYNLGKLEVEHKWKNGEKQFSVADGVKPFVVDEAFMKEEIAKYGLTTEPKDAAYLLPKGEMLKGGETLKGVFRGHDFLRGDIEARYQKPKDVTSEAGVAAWDDARDRRVREAIATSGLVRLSGSGAEVFERRLTDEQYDKLWDHLDWVGEDIRADESDEPICIDYSDAHGENLFSAEYDPRTSPSRILRDMREWYDERKIPEGATGRLVEMKKAEARGEMAFSTSQVAGSMVDKRLAREASVREEQVLDGMMIGDRYHEERPTTSGELAAVRPLGYLSFLTIQTLTLDNRLRFGEKSLSDYIKKDLVWKGGKRQYLFTQKDVTEDWVKKQVADAKSVYHEQALYFVATALLRERERDKMTAWGWNGLVFKDERQPFEWWDYRYPWAKSLTEEDAEDAARKLIELKANDVDWLANEIRQYGSDSVMASDADDILSNMLAHAVAARLGVKVGRSDHVAFVDFSGYASQRYVNAIKDAFEAGHTVIDGIFTLCHEKHIGYCQFFPTDIRENGDGRLEIKGEEAEAWNAMKAIAQWANPVWTPAVLKDLPGYQDVVDLLYRVPRYALAHTKPNGLIAADDPKHERGVQILRLGYTDAFVEALEKERERVRSAKIERIAARKTWSDLGIRQILNAGTRQTLDDGVKRHHAVDGDLLGDTCTDWEFLTKHRDCKFEFGGEMGLLERSAIEAFERITKPHRLALAVEIAKQLPNGAHAHTCLVVPCCVGKQEIEDAKGQVEEKGGSLTDYLLPNAFDQLLAEKVRQILRSVKDSKPFVNIKYVRVDAETGVQLADDIKKDDLNFAASQVVILAPDAGDGAVVAEVASAIRSAVKHPAVWRLTAAALSAEAGGKVGVTEDDLEQLRREKNFDKLPKQQLERLLGYAASKSTLAEIRTGLGLPESGAANHSGIRNGGAGSSGSASSILGVKQTAQSAAESGSGGPASSDEGGSRGVQRGSGVVSGETAWSVAAWSAAADLEDEKRHTVGGLKHVVRAPRGGAQKRGDTIYPDAGARLRDMQFSVGARRKEEIRNEILAVRKDFDEGDIGIVLEEIDKYDKPKKVNLAVHWIITGAITLPQDEYKLDEALKLADKKKGVDLFAFKSPEEVFALYQTPLVDSRIINPDDVPELKRSAELADGVVIYDVDETLDWPSEKERKVYDDIKDPIAKKAYWKSAEEHGVLRPRGQVAMRKILNSHWGKEASPWCLLQGDANGNLTPQSLHWWKNYSGLPKRVAFKDGKLLSFMGTDKNNGAPPIPGQPAGDKCREQWWDRKDQCSWLGVPFEGELPGDPLHRSTCVIYQRNNKRALTSGFWRGNKNAGRYEYWSDIATLAYRYDTENGKRIYDIKWNADGEVEELCRNGESVSRYAPNGRFHASPRYFEGNKCSGRLVDVDDKALVRYEDYGAVPHLESHVRVEWGGLGGIESYSKYRLSENGLHVGTPTRISRYVADNVTTFTFWRENGEIVSARFEQGRLRMSNLAGVFVESRDNEIVLSAHNLENGGQARFYTPSGQTSLPQPVLEQMLQEARREIEEALRKTLDEIDYLMAKYSGENMPTLPAIPAVPGMKDKELFALWKSNDEILDAKGEPTAEQIAFARARREAAEEGREGVSYSVADAADYAADGTAADKTQAAEGAFFANGRQKQGGRVYPDIGAALRDAAFSVADVRERVAKARSELPPERIDAFMAELAKLETPKLKKLCAHWFVKGAIELPKDLPRVKYAVRLGELNKRDLFRFASPLDAIRAIEGERGAIGVRIDPDDVPYLFNRTDIGDGVVIYDVSEVIAPDDDGEYWRRFEEAYRKGDDEERRRINVEAEQNGVVLRPCGQIAVRKIMNSHWGKDASPWCLLQGDKNGRLTGRSGDDEDGDAYNSAYYWERYSSLPKRVAFKDGEIVSFMGTDEEMDEPHPTQPKGDVCAEQWWDRDDAHYPGVPVVQEIKGDALKRKQNYIHLRGGEIVPWGEAWIGNRYDGVSYVWTEGENSFLRGRLVKADRRTEENVLWNRLGMVTDVQTKSFEGRWGGYTGRAEQFTFRENGKICLTVNFSTKGVSGVATRSPEDRMPGEIFAFDYSGIIGYKKRADGTSRVNVEFERTQRYDELRLVRENGDLAILQTRVGSMGTLKLLVQDKDGNVKFSHTEYNDVLNPPTLRMLEDQDIADRGEASLIRGLADEVENQMAGIYRRGALLKEGYDAMVYARPDIPAKPDLTDAEIAAALPKREDYEPEKVIERVLLKHAQEEGLPVGEDVAYSVASSWEAEADPNADADDEMRFSAFNRKYDWSDYGNLMDDVLISTTHNNLVGHDGGALDVVYARFKAMKASGDLAGAEAYAEYRATARISSAAAHQGQYLLGKHFGRLDMARLAARHFYSDRRLAQLARIVGTEPARWVYVRNADGKATNMMPRAFAELLAQRFGGKADGTIRKVSDERNTAATMVTRAGRNFQWEGTLDLAKGEKVFLVDDMWTTGSTTMSLLEYLKDQGVDATAVVTLAFASNGHSIRPRARTIGHFLKKSGYASLEEATAAQGVNFSRWTDSELHAYAIKGKWGKAGLTAWIEEAKGFQQALALDFGTAKKSAEPKRLTMEDKLQTIRKRPIRKPAPRQAMFDFGGGAEWRASIANVYPELDAQSDDDLLVQALAARGAVDPRAAYKNAKSKTGYGFIKVNKAEVEKLVRRAHPEWANDERRIKEQVSRVSILAQMEMRNIRRALDAGVSESAILERLPKKMQPFFKEELREHEFRGAKAMNYGMRAQQKLVERAAKRERDAAAVQSGVESGLFEQWAGVNFAETLMAVLQNRREASEDTPKKAETVDNPELAEAAEAIAKAGGGVADADGQPLKVEQLEDPGRFANYILELASKFWRKEKGLKDDTPVGQDAVSLQFLRRTAMNVYHKIVKDIVYSGARETALRNIERFAYAPGVGSLRTAMTFVGEIIHARHVRETKQELCEKLDTFLKMKLGASGRFKADKEELRRKVTAELELRARYMRHAIWLTREAAAEEALIMTQRLGHLTAAYDDAGSDIEQSREYREIQRQLNILREFGALRYRPLTEILGAQQYWEEAANGSTEEILARMREREVRTQKAADILAAAVANPKRTERVEAGKATTVNNYIVGHMGFVSMLQDMIRYSKGAERAAAEAIIDYIALEIQKAGDGAAIEKRREGGRFYKAVEQIYGRPFRKVMAEMQERDERFAPFMNVRGGKRVPPTKARAMQLLVSLLQGVKPGDSYFDNVVRHGRQEQAAQIAAMLSKEDMQMINWLRMWYEDNRAGLSEVCAALFGIGVYSESPSYFPVKMLLEKQGLEAAEGVGWTAFPKALTPRVKNERDFDTSADIFSLWQERMEEGAQWKAHARLGLEMRGIFGRSNLQEAVVSNHGSKINKLMLQFVTDILSGSAAADRSDSGVGVVSDKIRGLTALTALAWNVGVMVKQTTSIPAFGFEIGLRRTATYALTMFSPAGMDAMAKIWDSEQRRVRWQTGNSEAVSNALRRRDANAVMRFLQAGMICNKIGDVVPGLTIGQGIYRDCIERGMSEEDAMATVWMLIERTQQSARMENQPTQQRRNKFGRVVYQFLSTQQQYLQYEMRAFRELAANPSAKTAKNAVRTVVLNHFILTTLYFWMGELYKAMLGAEPPEDRLKDWMISNLLGPFGALFVLGFCCSETLERALKGKSYGKSSSMMPMEEFIKRTIGDTADLVGAIFDRERTWGDVMDELVDALSGVSAPVRDARKIDRNIIRPEVYEADERRKKRRRAMMRRRRE